MSSPHVVVYIVICIVEGRIYVKYLSDKSPDFMPGLRKGPGMDYAFLSTYKVRL